MSQAPSLQRHSYIMVDNDRHHDDEVNPASHSHRTSSSYSQSHEQSQRQSHTQQDTAPPSPPLRPADNSNRQSTSTENSHQYGFDQSGFPLSADPRGLHSSPSSPRLGPTYRSTRSLGGSEATSPSRLKVRDLAHIQSFASQEYMSRPRLGGRHFEAGRQYEISSMPVGDIIEMVAGLITRITSTNDRQHEQANRPGTSQDSSASSHASCVLAFHGKNVPSISILSYLTRIHKYCPTTYEVFLSLLVYFDRMTDNFNKKFLESAIQSSRSDSSDSHASSDTLTEDNMHDIESSQSREGQSEESDPPQYFVVDSYNIHRLVIAGVTCASKFFSDVFYTNSRYAKVSLFD